MKAVESGIYCIENTWTGKRYVGSSRNAYERIKRHLRMLKRGEHHSAKLQNSWNKYGEAVFEAGILLRCPESELIAREQEMIVTFDSVNNGYNMAKIAGAPMRGRKMSEKTKEKMRAAHANRAPISNETRERQRAASLLREQEKREAGYVVSEETRAKLSEAGRGRIVTDEVREKIRVANIGTVLSEEHRQKLSVAHSGKTLTEEHRQKIAEGGRKRWEKVREVANMGLSQP